VTQRYTRYVKILRLILPVVAGISLLALLIWPWWQEKKQFKLKQAHEASVAHQNQSASTAPLQVQKPEYQGTDHAGRPYYVTADRVEQSLDPKAPLLLIQPQAALNLGQNKSDQTATVTLNAAHGLYDMQAQTIDLKEKVIFDYAGYTLHTDDLALDMLGGAATTNSPVTGQGPRGTLEAQRLTIEDKGARIVLKGPGRLVFYTNAPSSETTTP
jgi:lipopolysaccharide export system protein LptC